MTIPLEHLEPKTLQILKIVNGKRRNIREISCILGEAQLKTGKRVKVLRVLGLVDVEFVGRERLVRVSEDALKVVF